MAKKLNPVYDNPETAKDLTKPYLMGWFKAHGTAEDKAWFVSLLENTPKVKKTNNLTKQEYERLSVLGVIDTTEKEVPEVKTKVTRKARK